MKKARQKKSSSKGSKLRVLNDCYLIEEDPMEIQNVSHDVAKAIEEKKLIIPDAFENYAKKYPMTGKIIAKGDILRYDLPLGTHALYAKFGGARYEHEGKQLMLVREKDVLATFA